MKKTLIEFEDLKIGMKIVDSDGDLGVILDLDDINNIDVRYGENGYGFLCLDKNCEDYTPIYKFEEK